MVKTSPVTVSLEPSKTTIVAGCPGVPRSIPRIETVINVRSVNGQPFVIRSVGVELRTIQKVSVPSTIGSNDPIHEVKIYEDPFLFNPTFGNFSEHLIGIDIPVLIYLPKDITSSGFNVNWNASTVHNLLVKVSVGDSVETELNFLETFPIPIKLYDNLPIYRQFTESINESIVSTDQQLMLEYHLKESCIGPDDKLNLNVKIMKNSLNYNVSQRLKLKAVHFQLKEILEGHEGGLPPYKDIKIFEKIHDERSMDLNLNNEININYNFKLPLNNDFLSVYDKNLQNNSIDKFKYFENNEAPIEVNNRNNFRQFQINEIEGIPITHYNNFTILGKLFSIRYEIIIKLKVSHGKDFQVRIPIILSPYNKLSSEYLLNWIINQCKVSNDRFGRDTVNQLINSYNIKECNTILSKYNKPLKIYKYTKTDWMKLGFSIDSFGTPSTLSQFID
ncbi:RHO1 GEF localizing protein 1 [[Candida] jaroonii]|uniref:RHO1 GEF localizing protein 1 n=1 Tax=[Candida] jaroonii TaxID=467808 RepID=A0ACA9Y1C3_9ASCO|nr:RHO1 GEF localizing protein 1 [[Candida] jaroonii]